VGLEGAEGSTARLPAYLPPTPWTDRVEQAPAKGDRPDDSANPAACKRCLRSRACGRGERRHPHPAQWRAYHREDAYGRL